MLNTPVKQIDITEFDSRPLIERMAGMSFSSREVANAYKTFEAMLNDPKCTIILSLAGSTSAAGCAKVYADMVRLGMVDIVVATGASIVDMDFFEALGNRHYQGSQFVDDNQLRELGIDRIYDTYISEDSLKECDFAIKKIADQLPPTSHSSREFIEQMALLGFEHSSDHQAFNRSLILQAKFAEVPIFCPAFVDSSAGFGLVAHQVERIKAGAPYVQIDSVADFRELTYLKVQSQDTGLLMVGGGVPKNFVQDTTVCAEILNYQTNMHKYAVQITVADSRDGACSSSTLKEACSWGKVDIANEQMVFAEASMVIPMIASAAYHNGSWKNRPRKRLSALLNSTEERVKWSQ